MERIQIAINASDPITAAGLARYIRSYPEMVLRDTLDEHTDLLVVAIEGINSGHLRALRRGCSLMNVPIVLIADEVDHDSLLVAIEHGVVAVLPRSAVTAERLCQAITVTFSGGAVVPHDLLGGLIKHFDRLRREALTAGGVSDPGLTVREVDVLRLMADGMDTAEIAHRMAYSERTIKAIISSATKRLHLRNRTHAVAFACRSGII